MVLRGWNNARNLLLIELEGQRVRVELLLFLYGFDLNYSITVSPCAREPTPQRIAPEADT